MYKVLIVEDDPMIAEINKGFLNKQNSLQCIGVAKGDLEVFEYMARFRVDLILMDIYLKNSNGVEILKKLRENGFLTDIIFISADNANNTLKEVFAYGGLDFLIKPYTQERFDLAIDKFLKKSNLLDNEMIAQKGIDNFNIIKEKSELPKGISQNTLNKILQFLSENPYMFWSAKTLAQEMAISEVTLNKYLKHLAETGRLAVKTSYGRVGRPENYYKYKQRGH